VAWPNGERSAGARGVLGLLAAALLVGVASWVPVAGRQVPGWERSLFRAGNDLPGFLYVPVWVVMQLGSGVAIPVAAGVALAFRCVRLAVGLAIAGEGASILASVFKSVVGRARPAALLPHVHVRGGVVAGNGYPSGHAAVAFALATSVALCVGSRWRWVPVVAAAVVGFARVYVGAHFPLDVVGGAALGAVCGAIVALVLRRGHSVAG